MIRLGLRPHLEEGIAHLDEAAYHGYGLANVARDSDGNQIETVDAPICRVERDPARVQQGV